MSRMLVVLLVVTDLNFKMVCSRRLDRGLKNTHFICFLCSRYKFLFDNCIGGLNNESKQTFLKNIVIFHTTIR
jgi:hypothetical protein